MTKYLSLKEIVARVELNVSKLENGELSVNEVQDHFELVRELYERTLILRYKAFENHSTVSVEKPTAPELQINPIVKENVQVQEVEVEIPTTPIEEPLLQFEEQIEENTIEETEEPAIEFDFFNSEPSIDFSSSESEIIQEVVAQETIEEEEEETYETVEETAEINHEFDVLPIHDETPSIEDSVGVSPFSEPTYITQEPESIEPTIVEQQNDSSGSSELFYKKVISVKSSISNQLGFSSLTSLVGSFGLNERLLYINELFDGSSEAFSDAVKYLDNRANLEDAASAVENYATKFNWDLDSETVEEFIQKLCRRYL